MLTLPFGSSQNSKNHCKNHRLNFLFIPQKILTLFKIREGAPNTFWLLVLTLLLPWCKISSSYLVSVPNYWTWTKTTPQKKRFFWPNPYKLEVMITCLIEMLELQNFGQMITTTVWFESRYKILLVTSLTKIMTW